MSKPYRSCSCRDPGTGKQLSRKCERLSAKNHGAWFVRFEAPPAADGKRRQPRLGPFATEKAAKDALVDVLGDVRSGTHTDDRRTTLAVYLTRWLEGQQLARKQRTYESYEEACRLYWIPALGHVRLADLREQHVRDAHKAMRKLNRPAEDGDRSEVLRRLAAARATMPHLPAVRVRLAPLTETRIQRVTAVLRAALNDCRALKVNPAAGIEIRVPKRKPILWTAERVTRWRESGGKWRPGPVMVWTPQQTGAFLDAIESDRLFTLYCLVAYCGLRRAEVAGLPWSEVDLDRGVITIRETRPGDDSDPDDPKSEAGERTITLSAMLAALLRAWRRQQLKERMAWGAAWADSGLVFTRENSQPLRPGHISEHFRLLVGKADVPPVRFHDLRHGSATLSLAAGVDIKIVQEMLGHATSAFTRDVYTSVVPEIATAAAEAVAAIVPRRARAEAAE
jgi:integrase